MGLPDLYTAQVPALAFQPSQKFIHCKGLYVAQRDGVVVLWRLVMMQKMFLDGLHSVSQRAEISDVDNLMITILGVAMLQAPQSCEGGEHETNQCLILTVWLQQPAMSCVHWKIRRDLSECK